MKVLAVAAALLLSSVAALAQSQTDCQSYFVGNILYTSCHGQPPRPAVGVDTSIYRNLQALPQIDVLGSMLKGAELRLAEEQARLAKEQAALARETAAAVAAQRGAVTAATPQPSAAVPTSASDLSASDLVGLYMPETMDGHWWNRLKERADHDDLTALAVRVAAVKGVFEGLDLPLMVASSSFDDYKAKRAAAWRSDLSLGQILTKIDGYYADPATLDRNISLAVALVMRVAKQ